MGLRGGGGGGGGGPKICGSKMVKNGQKLSKLVRRSKSRGRQGPISLGYIKPTLRG